jgi:hypothetical protein
MQANTFALCAHWLRPIRYLLGLTLLLLLSDYALAVPLFARQTGQRCITCHAGGQFPELTPFGRRFKLTGYTLGQRLDVPLAAMAIASYTKTSNTTSGTPDVDFPRDSAVLFQTASIFAGGRINDHAGLFAQVTYDNYANQDPVTRRWSGHTHADNIDLRYATQLAGPSDWLIGFSLNNNPSVSDVWNTAPAWIQYVPSDFGFTGPAAAPMITQLGQQAAGITAYTMWNQALYAELGIYRAASGGLSFLKAGNEFENRLRRTAPYLRLAASRDWGVHSAMVGLMAMNARTYADPAATDGPTTAYHDRAIDMQYQYLGDAHTATGQLSYIHERMHGGDVSGISEQPSTTLRQWRLKGSYVYQGKLGAALSYFRTNGSSDSILYPGQQDDGTGTGATTPIPITGSALNNPDTRGWVPEVFWIPWQHLRIGAQYTRFNRYNGARNNYDDALRNAKDNNTLFVYAWFAY